jgi:putative acetyltransferase
MIVRTAVPPDIAPTAAVAAASYRAAFAAILEPETLAKYDPAFFATRFAASLPRLRVAERNGTILGFCLMTEGHIDMIFVAPAAIGTGAGHALLADAQTHGATSLECFAANTAARSFYERHAWRVTQSYTRPFAGQDRAFVRYEAHSG